MPPETPPPSKTASILPSGAAVVGAKVVVAGGFGVGKTTLVGSVSEIPPLTTEEYLTCASTSTDNLELVREKATTTVSMDFGRITFTDPVPMVLYLFGTPGQDRFLFFWDDLSYGAVGAVVLADTRRLGDSFTAVEYFEHRQIPFIVAINEFDSACHRYTPDEIREALEVPDEVPVLTCDARDTRSAATVLIALVSHALTHMTDHTHPSTSSGAQR